MVGLGFLPGVVNIGNSNAHAVSADGSVVVGTAFSPSNPNYQAFIWDAAHGMRSLQQVLTDDGLNLTGWVLTDARAISADGNTIVGNGLDPNGKGEAWIANIPEPGTGLLVSMGLMCLAVAGMHRSV
jgi:probable HAF family extracellular repeat protein